jgi:hypothetical protein
MWECESCGCQGIAGDLVVCPVCRKERPAAPVGDLNLVGEHGPELWDRSKSVAENLRDDPMLAGGGLVSPGVTPLLDEPGPAPFVMPKPTVPPDTATPPASEQGGDGDG